MPDEEVPYQSLYRRYRPQRFSEVRGQEHVTRALLNAVRDHKVAHAYLFSGPRGTGKTSTARILAMALNCEHQVEGEPDGTCASCLEIRNGSSIDVQELDAASNRRLEEMRDLLSRVSLGTRSQWKVYIIDEVHQLTPDAASALLKTLEEPPPHVVFVLATTDPQKVLPTIRSRTQHFEFRLLGAETLSGLLSDINQAAGLGVEPEDLDVVLRRGHGSARDALSALDQVAAAGGQEDSSELVEDLAEALAGADVAQALVVAGRAAGSGRDPRRLASDLLEHLRNSFLSVQARDLVLLSDQAVARLEQQARRTGLRRLVQAMDIIGQAATEIRDSVDPRITLEVALVKVCAAAEDQAGGAGATPPSPSPSPGAGGGGAGGGGADLQALQRQVASLEARLAALEAGQGGTGSPSPSSSPSSSSPSSPAPPPQGRPASTSPRMPSQAAPGPGPRPQRTAPPRPGRPAPPTRGEQPAARPGGGPPRPGAPRPPTQVAAAPGPTPSPEASVPAPASAPAPTQSVAAPAAAGVAPASSGGGLPTRDQVTLAWGDVILPALPGSVKAYTASARCVEVGDAVVMAVPDQGLLNRAQAKLGDLEQAFAAHFGRPIPIRLVVDDHPGGPPTAGGSRPGGQPAGGGDDGSGLSHGSIEEEIASIDPNELEDAEAGVISPEQAIFDAFPGAKEVEQ